MRNIVTLVLLLVMLLVSAALLGYSLIAFLDEPSPRTGIASLCGLGSLASACWLCAHVGER